MLRLLPNGSDICEALSKISSSGIITIIIYAKNNIRVIILNPNNREKEEVHYQNTSKLLNV